MWAGLATAQVESALDGAHLMELALMIVAIPIPAMTPPRFRYGLIARSLIANNDLVKIFDP